MKTSLQFGFAREISNQRSLLLGLTAIALLVQFSGNLQAAKVPRAILKSYFQTGDKPTAPQFATLIDSVLNLSDDSHLLGLRSVSPGASDAGAALLTAGVLVDASTPFGPAAGLDDAWLGQTGYLALSFTQGSSPEPHYGYLTITAGGSDLYPMFVSSFTYEDQPNTPILITQVPEPSSLALAAAAGMFGIGYLRRRARWKRSA